MSTAVAVVHDTGTSDNSSVYLIYIGNPKPNFITFRLARRLRWLTLRESFLGLYTGYDKGKQYSMVNKHIVVVVIIAHS